MKRLRVGSLQYFIRPVDTFDRFADQVTGLVETAADYRCHLLVFPEYFTVQLLTLGDLKRPIAEQIRWLASQRDAYVELLGGLAQRCGLTIVGGTIPGVDGGRLLNECHVFGPTGGHVVQRKLHMTRFESEEWGVVAGERLRIIEAPFGRMAVTVCYDVEFPELVRAAARAGVQVLVVPSCTDDRQGYLRVRYCAHARAVENQIYVVQSSTVGSLPMVPAVSLNYGQAAILTPSDFAFARDGILAEGIPNQESMVIGDLNLETIVESRESGTVLPLHDSLRSAEIAAITDLVAL